MIGHGGSLHNNVTNRNNNGSVEVDFIQVLNGNFVLVETGFETNDKIHNSGGMGRMSGDISVIADGRVRIIGSDDRSFAKVGHGGLGQPEVNDDEVTHASTTFVGGFTFNDLNPDGMKIEYLPGVTEELLDVVLGENLDNNGATNSLNDNDIDLDEAVADNDGVAPDRWSLLRIGDELIGVRNRDNNARIDVRRGVGGTPVQEHSEGDQIFQVFSPGTPFADEPARGYQRGTKEGSIVVEGAVVEMLAAQRTNVDSTSEAFVQIGHGGNDSPGAAAGNISVVSDTDIVAHASQSSLSNNWSTTAQIGHGGINSGVTTGTGGTIRENNGNGDANAFDASLGGHRGAIFVEARNGRVELLAGIHTNNYTMIGHGGTNAVGNHNATLLNDGIENVTSGAIKDGITVSATGEVILSRHLEGLIQSGSLAREGRGDQAFTMIGLGGYNSTGRFVGDIDVDSGGNLLLQGGNNRSFAQIGHGGWGDAGGRFAHATLTGDIDVDVAGNLTMRSGYFDNDAYTQIGHGGFYKTADEAEGHNGNINVDVAGSISMATGSLDRPGGELQFQVTGNNAYTMIGHGGWRSRGDHVGDVYVNSGGSLKIETFGGWREYNPGTNRYNGTSTGLRNFGQIGHGGWESDFLNAGNTNVQATGTGAGVIDADVTINVAGNVDLISSERNGVARFSSADPINNGLAITDQTDQISGPNNEEVDPVDQVFAPIVRSRENYIIIGHGGRGSGQNQIGAELSGDITLNSGGSLTMRGGGFDNATDLSALVDSHRTLFGDADDGVGAAPTAGQHQGDIWIYENFVKIGHGGIAYRQATDGNISVNTVGSVTMTAGEGGRDAVTIGSGGFETDQTDDAGERARRDGSVTVRAGGSISLTGSGGGDNDSTPGNQYAYAQIGADAALGAHDMDYDITVIANGNISLTAGTGGLESYAQIGNGGINRVRGDIDGDITVRANGSITLVGDLANGSTNVSGGAHAKIGHGTRFQEGQATNGRALSTGSQDGDIFVSAGNSIFLADGFIGHVDESSGLNSASSTAGNTFVAIDRNNPLFSGENTGVLAMDANSGIASADPFTDNALRLYLPNRPSNLISVGALLNDSPYVGTPGGFATIDTARDDELLDFPEFAYEAEEIAFTAGDVVLTNNGTTTMSGAFVDASFDVPMGDFTPEGDYPAAINTLGGSYFLFYNNLGGLLEEVETPVVETPVETVPTPFVFDFIDFVTPGEYEAFDRYEELYGYDGYEGQLYSIALSDAQEEEGDPSTGGWIFEEMLDSSLGSRRDSQIETGSTVLEDEADEEMERRKRFAARQVGRGSLTFYVFDPGTNQYSSYRVFGVPQSSLPTAQ